MSITWNTGLAAERARKKIKKLKKAGSNKQQASSNRRLKKDTILK